MADRDELIEDYRQFTREMMARFDRALREMRRERLAAVAELREQREESRRHWEENRRSWEENRRSWEENRRSLDEIIEENRAQRRALFAILDRLEGGGRAPAT